MGYRWQPPKSPQPMVPLHPTIALQEEIPLRAEQTREPPYVLRGREEEFNRIAARLSLETGSLSVVEGAPGTGKSSLLEALGRYAEQQGFAHIRVTRQQLYSLRLFHRAVNRRYPAAPLRRTWNWQTWLKLSTSGDAAVAKGQIEAGITATPDPNEIEEARTSIQRALAQQIHARGLLITIDDAQGTLRETGASGTTWTTLCSIISTLNDQLKMKESRYPVCTVIAGVPSTIEEISLAASRRLAADHTTRLDRISEKAVRASIQDCLQIADAEGFRSTAWPQTFIDEVVRDCTGEAIHATACGRALLTVGLAVSRADRTTPNDGDVSQARAAVSRAMRNNYASRWQGFRPCSKLLMRYLADAVHRHGPWLRWVALERLIRTVADDHLSDQRPTEDSWIGDLLAQGCILQHDPRNQYPRHEPNKSDRDQGTIDLASFAEYINAQENKTTAEYHAIAQLVDAAVPDEDRNLSPWQWVEVGEITPIERLAPTTLSNPYALLGSPVNESTLADVSDSPLYVN